MKRHGPWSVQSSKEVYKNQWITVREDAVVHDNGHTGVYGVVTLLSGVCVLPMDTEGNVYLAKQFRYGLGADSIEGPGGAIDAGESPLETAKRELLEEMGITAETWIDLGYVNSLTGVLTHSEYLFLAKDIICPEKLPFSKEESITLVKISLEEAVELVMESKITHGPSCVLILKAVEYLRKNT